MQIPRVTCLNFQKSAFVFHWRKSAVLNKESIEAFTSAILPLWSGEKEQPCREPSVRKKPVDIFFKENSPSLKQHVPFHRGAIKNGPIHAAVHFVHEEAQVDAEKLVWPNFN